MTTHRCRFWLRIGIEGEKAFKDALRNINQSFKALGSEMQLVTGQFDKNDISVRALDARNDMLNKEIDQQREKISTLRSVLQNTSDSFGENDRRTQSWQIQPNKAQAELNGMERELEQNSRSMEDLSRAADDGEGTTRSGSCPAKSAISTARWTGKKTSRFGDMLTANLLSKAITGGIRALGRAERFQSLTLAFAQASSAGKLTGQDLLQMINTGVNPLEEISRKTGKSIGDLKREME